MKSHISLYVATRQSHSDDTIKIKSQKPKFMVYGAGKLYSMHLGEFFSNKKLWGNSLREILCNQKSRGNGLGELVTSLKI